MDVKLMMMIPVCKTFLFTDGSTLGRLLDFCVCTQAANGTQTLPGFTTITIRGYVPGISLPRADLKMSLLFSTAGQHFKHFNVVHHSFGPAPVLRPAGSVQLSLNSISI